MITHKGFVATVYMSLQYTGLHRCYKAGSKISTPQGTVQCLTGEGVGISV